jgi:aminoglycoside-2''-adenylyltransferase
VRTWDEVRAVGRFLGRFPGPWWIAGGWAIDLWLDSVSRDHEDIEVSVLRQDQAALHVYCGAWPMFTPRNNEWVPLPPDVQLVLPEFQLQVRPPPDAPPDPSGLPPEFEFMLNDVEAGKWIFRPEPRIRRAWEYVRLPSTAGLPVTAPEVQLLHKARHHRPKDEHDFAQVRPHLNLEQRLWLRTALAQILPADPWLAQLEE